jgi:hypothetical protein
MANPIIKILRGATPPSATLQAGQFAVDQVAKNLYLGVEVGGVVTNEIVGGSGTFATKTYVDSAVSAGTGSLGTMATQNANSVAITGGAIDGTTIGATSASSGAFTTLTASNAPSASTDVVRKTDLDSAISALGSVFHYVGNVSAATGNDLDTLSDTTTGAYYKVDADGTYTASGGFSAAAKVGDAFVKTSTGWQKLDNVDAVVSGTANEIAVTGDENAGYTVAIDPAFSYRVSTAESYITNLETKTQNIDLAGTTASMTQFNGVINAGSANFNYLSATFSADVGELFVNNSSGMGNLSVAGTTTLQGNLVGNGTNQITDFIIDGGVY